MTARAQKLLSRAVQAAEKTMKKGAGGPFGAVIAKGDRVIAVASNSVLKNHDSTCHAEINAIRMACRKLKTHVLAGLDIYSTTEPCPMCFSAIHWAKISRVYYGTVIADVKRLGFNELTISNAKLKKWGKSPVKLMRVDSNDCRKLLQTWKNLPKKQVY